MGSVRRTFQPQVLRTCLGGIPCNAPHMIHNAILSNVWHDVVKYLHIDRETFVLLVRVMKKKKKKKKKKKEKREILPIFTAVTGEHECAIITRTTNTINIRMISSFSKGKVTRKQLLVTCTA
jgi:hypothetical protein